MTTDTIEKKVELKFQVVDDTPQLRTLAKAILKKFYNNAEVYEAENGAQALEQLASGFVPDLILSDVTMPVMGGVEFVSKMKAQYPSLKALLVTAENNPDLIAESCGADGYIGKPYNHDELRKTIDLLLAK